MALKDYIYNKPVIETDRLILRPLASSDISALKEWMLRRLLCCRELKAKREHYKPPMR